MLVEKKATKEIFAMKSLRKEELIDKDQIEHTKTEKMILETVTTLKKRDSRIQDKPSFPRRS